MNATVPQTEPPSFDFSPPLLGNDETYELLTSSRQSPKFPFSLKDSATELYEYLLSDNPLVVEGAGLERTCRWWHPLLPADNTYGRDEGRPWYDKYGSAKNQFRIHRFMYHMADDRFAMWRGESIGTVASAIWHFFQETKLQVRHRCPVSDADNPDIRERVKLCIEIDHLALGTAAQNAEDGRWADPDAVLTRVKAQNAAKAWAEDEARSMKETRSADCIAFVTHARRVGLRRAARDCHLHPDVAGIIYKKPPRPARIPNFNQGVLV